MSSANFRQISVLSIDCETGLTWLEGVFPFIVQLFHEQLMSLTINFRCHMQVMLITYLFMCSKLKENK